MFIHSFPAVLCYHCFSIVFLQRAHGVDESGELKYVGGRQKKHGTGSGGEGLCTLYSVCVFVRACVCVCNVNSIPYCTYLLLYFYSLVSPGMASHSSPMSPDEVTRVVYYLDKDETPYRTSIPKRSVLNTKHDCTNREFANKSQLLVSLCHKS